MIYIIFVIGCEHQLVMMAIFVNIIIRLCIKVCDEWPVSRVIVLTVRKLLDQFSDAIIIRPSTIS